MLQWRPAEGTPYAKRHRSRSSQESHVHGFPRIESHFVGEPSRHARFAVLSFLGIDSHDAGIIGSLGGAASWRTSTIACWLSTTSLLAESCFRVHSPAQVMRLAWQRTVLRR